MPIARFAVQRRIAVAMIALAIIVLGLFAIPRLAVALLPNFTPPVVTVSVNYPNVSPDAIETLVTRPIENAVSRVNGIQEINSTSSEGQSIVTAQFHYGVNIDTAAVDVQEQVARIANLLPNDPTLGKPEILKFDPNQLPVVTTFVSDGNMSLRDLGDLWTNTLSDELSSVDGVAAVTVSNDQQRAIMIEPNAGLLAAYGVTMSQIVARIQQENVNLPAGIVQIANDEYQVRANELYKNARDVAATVITTKNGAPVRLSDLARVTDSITEQRSFERLNGVPSISVSVTAQPDANVVATAIGVYKKIAQLQKRYPGMHFGVVFDQRGFIVAAIGALEHTAMYGAILAVVVILLFLHSWRSTLIVAISLPISVLGTLFAAYLLHYSLNVMTLGGLALAVGLIVDDAIVVIENIYRHMARGQRVKEAAQGAVAEIFSAVVASSITVITVFVPLVLIPGLQGLIFTPFAVMVMVAVALSLLVAVTTVPMLSTVLLRDERPHRNGAGAGAYTRFVHGFDALYEGFAARYRRLLSWAIDRPGRVVAVAALIFVATLVVIKLGAVQTEIFPQTNSRYARFFLRMPVGTALSVTNAVTEQVERRLRRDPRVQDVGAQVGTTGFFFVSQVTNRATVQVTLKRNTSSAQAAQFVQQWQAKLASIPGLLIFGHTIDIVSNVISRGQNALQIQIFGPDVNTLYRIAKTQAIPKLAQVRGITRPDTNVTDAQPELDVYVDRGRAAQLGLSAQTISQTIDTATSGTIASYLQINGTEYPIVVQLPPDERRSYASVAGLSLSVPSAGTGLLSTTVPVPGESFQLTTIPLSDVASIRIGSGPSEISRENKQREIDIDADLLGIPLGRALQASTKIMNAIALPAGYRWQFGPAIAQQNDTFSSLGLIVVLAILLVYMLLASQFESLLQPLIIMMSVPLSLAGVVLALIVTHRSFGLTAFIGVLMLVGIVVKNAILVVEFSNQLRRRGLSAREAVMQAAPLRLRPIVMTTLATVGGMLPIAIGLETGSQTQAPLGTVVIGGLICSTMLSLVVIPTLYLWAATHIEPRFAPRSRPSAVGAPPTGSHAPSHGD